MFKTTAIDTLKQDKNHHVGTSFCQPCLEVQQQRKSRWLRFRSLNKFNVTEKSHTVSPAELLRLVQYNLSKVFQILCHIIYRIVFLSRCTFDYYYGVALMEFKDHTVVLNGNI
jgi:hypothetical protein